MYTLRVYIYIYINTYLVMWGALGIKVRWGNNVHVNLNKDIRHDTLWDLLLHRQNGSNGFKEKLTCRQKHS